MIFYLPAGWIDSSVKLLDWTTSHKPRGFETMTLSLWGLLSWYPSVCFHNRAPGSAAGKPLTSFLSETLSMLPLLSISKVYYGHAAEAAARDGKPIESAFEDFPHLEVFVETRDQVLTLVTRVFNNYNGWVNLSSNSSSTSSGNQQQQEEEANSLLRKIMYYPALSEAAVEDLAGLCKCLYARSSSSSQQEGQGGVDSSARTAPNSSSSSGGRRSASAATGTFADLALERDHEGIGGPGWHPLTAANAFIWNRSYSTIFCNQIRPARLLEAMLKYQVSGTIDPAEFQEATRDGDAGSRTLPHLHRPATVQRLKLALEAVALIAAVQGAAVQLVQVLDLLAMLCHEATDMEARVFLESRGALLVKVLVLAARGQERVWQAGEVIEGGNEGEVPGVAAIERVMNSLMSPLWRSGDILGEFRGARASTGL